MTKRNPELFIVYKNAGNLAWWQGRRHKDINVTFKRVGVRPRDWMEVRPANQPDIDFWKAQVAAQEGFA